MAKIYDKAQFDFYYSTKIGCPKKKTRISFVFIEYINLYLVKSRKEKQEKMIPKKKSGKSYGKRIELSSSCYDPAGGRRKKIRAILTFDHVMMILSSFGTKSQFAGSFSLKTTCVLLMFF